MSSEEKLIEAGNRLAFAAGALNVATDSQDYIRGERGNVLDALKGWKDAITAWNTRPAREEVSGEALERLRTMSKQKLLSELDEDDRKAADVEGGYDQFVKEARFVFAAMNPKPAEAPQDHWTVKALIKAGNALSAMAQTTGGTAGPDGALMAAIDQWSSVRKIVEIEGDDPMIATAKPAEAACDLGAMHGKASTYTNHEGIVCCDFCGHPTEDASGAGEDFQSGVARWMMACFGPEISNDRLERGDRFIEEALELAQTVPGFNRDRALALVDYVFARPIGEQHQEVGGVMVTLAALCNTFGLNIAQEADRELARVWTKVEAIRAKQAAKPTGSALPVAVSTPPAADVAGLREARAILSDIRRMLGADYLDRIFGPSMKARIDALAALPEGGA